jgi:hypothetical protein
MASPSNQPRSFSGDPGGRPADRSACKIWAKLGHCPSGSSCPYWHDPIPLDMKRIDDNIEYLMSRLYFFQTENRRWKDEIYAKLESIEETLDIILDSRGRHPRRAWEPEPVGGISTRSSGQQTTHSGPPPPGVERKRERSRGRDPTRNQQPGVRRTKSLARDTSLHARIGRAPVPLPATSSLIPSGNPLPVSTLLYLKPTDLATMTMADLKDAGPKPGKTPPEK